MVTMKTKTAPDWSALRALFPALKEYAYFGWAATAPLSTRAADTMTRHVAEMRDQGSLHWRDWYQTYDAVRAEAAKLTGATADEIALLKNTGEGLSTIASGLSWKPEDNLVLPRGEFPANLYPWLALRERGVVVRRIDTDAEGRFTAEDVDRQIDDRTRLVALSWVNYSTGFRADLQAIGALCRERGVFFCVDVIQGLGVLPLDVAAAKIDAVCADGHKWLCAPEGLAVFYLRRELQDRVRPISLGWWSAALPARFDLEDQPLAKTARRFECGTLPTTNAYGLREALALINETGVTHIAERVQTLTASLVAQLRARGCQILRAEGENEWSGIVSFTVPGRDARELAADLEKKKIIVTPRGERMRVAVHAWNDEHDIERLLATL
jgi:selenocysteine lyase/cysteine desulfurase